MALKYILNLSTNTIWILKCCVLSRWRTFREIYIFKSGIRNTCRNVSIDTQARLDGDDMITTDLLPLPPWSCSLSWFHHTGSLFHRFAQLFGGKSHRSQKSGKPFWLDLDNKSESQMILSQTFSWVPWGWVKTGMRGKWDWCKSESFGSNFVEKIL